MRVEKVMVVMKVSLRLVFWRLMTRLELMSAMKESSKRVLFSRMLDVEMEKFPLRELVMVSMELRNKELVLRVWLLFSSAHEPMVSSLTITSTVVRMACTQRTWVDHMVPPVHIRTACHRVTMSLCQGQGPEGRHATHLHGVLHDVRAYVAHVGQDVNDGSDGARGVCYLGWYAGRH